MADSSRSWWLEDFDEKLEAWDALESPSDELRVYVAQSLFTRQEDPYPGAERQEGFDNLWFWVIPGSADSDGRVVTCTYWIYEKTHSLVCDNFASLNPPF